MKARRRVNLPLGCKSVQDYILHYHQRTFTLPQEPSVSTETHQTEYLYTLPTERTLSKQVSGKKPLIKDRESFYERAEPSVVPASSLPPPRSVPFSPISSPAHNWHMIFYSILLVTSLGSLRLPPPLFLLCVRFRLSKLLRRFRRPTFDTFCLFRQWRRAASRSWTRRPTPTSFA